MRMVKMKIFWSCCAATAGLCSTSLAAGQGDEGVVVFNSQLPESKELAFYYAQRREVPTNQVLGFDLPIAEAITRAEFRDRLPKPLLKALERQKMIRTQPGILPATRDRTGDAFQKVIDSKIRYATVCYGVPVKILNDPNLSEPGTEKVRVELRRNDAALDSELAALPLLLRNLSLTSPARNPVYGVTNAALIHPTNGVLVVARLDGPSDE